MAAHIPETRRREVLFSRPSDRFEKEESSRKAIKKGKETRASSLRPPNKGMSFLPYCPKSTLLPQSRASAHVS